MRINDAMNMTVFYSSGFWLIKKAKTFFNAFTAFG